MPVLESPRGRSVRIAVAGPVDLQVVPRPEPGFELIVEGPNVAVLAGVELRQHDSEVTVTSSGMKGLGSRLAVTVRAGQPVSIDAAAPALTVRAAAPLAALRAGAFGIDLVAATIDTVFAGFSQGSLDIGEVRTGLTVGCGNGTVRVAQCSGALRVKSTAGLVHIDRFSGVGHARIGAAAFQVAALSGQVDVRTSSGAVAIGIDGASAAWLDVSSQTGRVEIDLPPALAPNEGEGYAEVYVRAGSADVHVFRANEDRAKDGPGDESVANDDNTSATNNRNLTIDDSTTADSTTDDSTNDDSTNDDSTNDVDSSNERAES